MNPIKTICIARQGPAGPAGLYPEATWSAGHGAYVRGTVLAHNDVVWLALRDTSVEPSVAAPDDWGLWLDFSAPVSGVVSVAGLTGVVTASALKSGLAIAAGDVSGLAASATTDATNAANIASGTLSNARLAGVALTANNLSDLANSATAAANLGVGAGSDVVHKTLALSGGTITASAPSLSAAQTWNSAGVTFTGLKLNVTDTASASSSLLIDLQAGGISKFSVAKDGSATNAGNIVTSGSGGDRFSAGLLVDSTKAQLRGIAYLGWSSSSIGGATDLSLFRDAANQLGQRNGTSAQKQNIYGTYASSTNYERLSLDAGQTTANVHRLTAEKGSGGGSLRPIAIDGYSKAGAMVASDIPQGTFAVFKDTSGGGVVLAYNDGGTLKTITLS